MNGLHYVLTTEDVCRFSGIENVVFRAWRHRGFLDGIGVQRENGHWEYNLYDAVKLSLIKFLCRGVCSISAASKIGKTYGPSMVARLAEQKGRYIPPRFLGMRNLSDLGREEPFVFTCDSIACASEGEGGTTVFVDFDEFIKNLDQDLAGLVREASFEVRVA